MVKKSTVILIAMLAVSVCTCWGYTVSKWPVPGIPNVAFCPGGNNLVCPEDTTLKGPVAPACEAPLIPGLIHAALSVAWRVPGYPMGLVFAGQIPSGGSCGVDLGEPAYVTAAVPCTPVNTYVPPRGW